jgi:hypothetical protein
MPRARARSAPCRARAPPRTAGPAFWPLATGPVASRQPTKSRRQQQCGCTLRVLSRARTAGHGALPERPAPACGWLWGWLCASIVGVQGCGWVARGLTGLRGGCGQAGRRLCVCARARPADCAQGCLGSALCVNERCEVSEAWCTMHVLLQAEAREARLAEMVGACGHLHLHLRASPYTQPTRNETSHTHCRFTVTSHVQVCAKSMAGCLRDQAAAGGTDRGCPRAALSGPPCRSPAALPALRRWLGTSMGIRCGCRAEAVCDTHLLRSRLGP